jgi:carboxylate-amine ligase
VLLALSANSPFWRSDQTGLLSTRTPIFRAFPRVGIPPAYRDWEDYTRQIGFMIASGVMEDYTYLWYDVRPHPRFGTVEVRVCDSQTRVEHTLGLAALIQAMIRELCEHYDAGGPLAEYPWQMLDENKWLAARHGLDGELVDLPSYERVGARALARRLLGRLREHAEDLQSVDELEGVADLITRGTSPS